MVQSWKRTMFQITMDFPDGSHGKVEVDGITMSEQPDIGLHVGQTHFIDATHIPTGKRIGQFQTLGAAVEFVHRIAHILPWSDPAHEFTAPEIAAITNTYLTTRASEQRPRRL